MQSTPVDKFYITRWQEHLCEKKICLGTKCQSHTHIKIVLDLLWQLAAGRKRLLELPFKPRNDREKKRNHYISHLWAKYGRSFTEESLADRFSCKALPQLQLPQVAFFRILSCWCARPFPPKCSLISSGLRWREACLVFRDQELQEELVNFLSGRERYSLILEYSPSRYERLNGKCLTLFAPAYFSVSKD